MGVSSREGNLPNYSPVRRSFSEGGTSQTSLSAEEYQVSENAEHYRSHDHLRQMFRGKQRFYRRRTTIRQTATAWRAMAAMMIEDGKRVAAGGTGF